MLCLAKCGYSALSDCTVQLVPKLPSAAVDTIVPPFMNHSAALPLEFEPQNVAPAVAVVVAGLRYAPCRRNVTETRGQRYGHINL